MKNLNVEFIKLGYRVSLEFKTSNLNKIVEIKKCIKAIGNYNKFNPEAVNKVISEIKTFIGSIQVGREYSPCLYIHFPYWTHQKANARGHNGERISDNEYRIQLERAKLLFKNARADEINEMDYGRVLRVWWD